MKKIIQTILQQELNDSVDSIQEINGLGSVNRIFEVKGGKQTYIFRLNNSSKEIEYRKEKWCLENVIKLGIPSPKVLKMGFRDNLVFMIQEKVLGLNGKLCSLEEKQEIWRNLGAYAAKYHTIQRIEEEAVEAQEFHKDWKARLIYNIAELQEKDSLLKNKILSQAEHLKTKQTLLKLKNIKFNVGLVHGDLCPRNVVWAKETTYLLDWGTAEINVVPHTEIGLVLLSKEASETEFNLFLEGLGISSAQYQAIEEEIHILNLLHQLDKYRWAEGYDVENLQDYGQKVQNTLNQIKLKYE